MSRWAELLESGERIVWEGRPAPRAFTFRNWRWSLAITGVCLLCLAVTEAFAVIDLSSDERLWLRASLVAAICVSWGGFFWARLEWERVFYLLTDRRLLAISGVFGQRLQVLPVAELLAAEPSYLGVELATVKVAGRSCSLVLHCLEHPQLLLDALCALAKQTGPIAGQVDGSSEGV